MDNLFDFSIQPSGELSTLAKSKKLHTLRNVFKYVKQLPYKRISDKNDLSLIIKEQQGTCSTKHAFVAALAKEQQLDSISLVLGIYKMHDHNTKGVGNVLNAYNLPYIIEAHTYLKLNGKRIDLTSSNEQATSFVEDLVHEEEIETHQIAAYKDQLHKTFLKQWKAEESIRYSLDTLWKIREECIEALS